jgi:hypothetical protein
MRKKSALYGIAVALVLVASTVALPAPRSANDAQSDVELVRPTAQTTGPITFHRLLRERLDWTLRLSRTLRLLQPTVMPESYGTNTIIDEPDPAGRAQDPDPLPGTRPRPIDRDPHPYEEAVNEDEIPLKELG